MKFINIPLRGIAVVSFLFVVECSKAQSSDSRLMENTAIYKDSSIISSWAIGCTIKRGPMNVAEPSLGLASVGKETSALGPAGENGVVSLGDGGEAVLTFSKPISNQGGFDFAVFENSFDGNFLELAFVEVSSDGRKFYRFPSISLTDTNIQVGTHESVDLKKIHNLAGKYPVFYGTPFDLDDLKNIAGLDLSNITHVKIIDVIGSLDDAYATRSAQGYKINDPWPTTFHSSGFDLDAVAVLRPSINSKEAPELAGNFKIHPNPVVGGQRLTIDFNEIQFRDFEVSLLNTLGEVIFQTTTKNPFQIETNEYEKGLHCLVITSQNIQHFYKIILE
ncbi:MAG TPA: T9SS type A sorting domain-containing protein [Cytophagaceae bacterium]|jgi:hypothetical protein